MSEAAAGGNNFLPVCEVFQGEDIFFLTGLDDDSLENEDRSFSYMYFIENRAERSALSFF